MIDITKEIDNFQGTEEELNTIATTIYECVDGSNTNDETFMDECESMLLCDYDWLKQSQKHYVIDKIEEIIENL